MEDNQQYSLPGDHVLEYDIKDPAKIKMSGWYNGHPLAKPLKYYEEGGYKNFGFQIGLPLLAGGDDSDPHGTHAVDFYNQALLPYFTNLKGSKRWRMRSVKGSYETTTLECKNGGLIGTMP
jgi:hypothetical protein